MIGSGETRPDVKTPEGIYFRTGYFGEYPEWSIHPLVGGVPSLPHLAKVLD